MPSHNQKGRSKRTPGGYVKVDGYVLDCPAWKALKPAAKVLYLTIKRRYRNYNGKNNNGRIPLSHREAINETGCSDRAIRKAFPDLIEKGFIRVTRNSSFRTTLAREYALTEHRLGDKLATKDFIRWMPDEKKSPVSTVNTGCVRSEHSKTDGKVHKVRKRPSTVSTVNTGKGSSCVHSEHTRNYHEEGAANPQPSNWICL